jgi:hypothetical protein
VSAHVPPEAVFAHDAYVPLAGLVGELPQLAAQVPLQLLPFQVSVPV